MNFPILEGSMDEQAVLVFLILFAGFGIPIILGIIALILWTKKKKKSAKVYLIFASVYLIISLGVCGSMML